MKVLIRVPQLEEWQDISHLLKADTYTKDRLLLNNQMESAIDTLSFTLIYDRLVAAYFLDIEYGEKIYIKSFTEGGTPDFLGYVTTAISLSKTDQVAPLSIQARDNTYRLDNKIQEDIQYPESMDSPGASVKDIFINLCRLAGYEDTEIDMSSEAPELVRMISEDKEQFTYRELFDQLLKQYGYVCYAKPDGVISLFRWMYQDVDPKKTLTHEFLVSQTFQIKKADETYDSVEIEWTEPDIISDVRLYNDIRIMGGSGEIRGELVDRFSYYPEGADKEDIFQEYKSEWLDKPFLPNASKEKNRDISLITTDRHKISTPDLSDDFKVLSEFGPRKARCRIYNPTENPLYCYGFEILGRALFRKRIKRTKIGEGASKQTFAAEYIYKKEYAAAYAEAMYRYMKYGDITYTFTLKDQIVSAGDIVRIVQKEPAIDTVVLILSERTQLGTPGVQYSAVGVSGVGDFKAIHSEYHSEMAVLLEKRYPLAMQRDLHHKEFYYGYYYTMHNNVLYFLNMNSGEVLTYDGKDISLISDTPMHDLEITDRGLLHVREGKYIYLNDRLMAEDGYSPTFWRGELTFIRDGKLYGKQGVLDFQLPEQVHKIKGRGQQLMVAGITKVWFVDGEKLGISFSDDGVDEGILELASGCITTVDIQDNYLYWKDYDLLYQYDTEKRSILPLYSETLDFATTPEGDIFYQDMASGLYYTTTEWLENQEVSTRMVTSEIPGTATAKGRVLTDIPFEILKTVKAGDLITGPGIPENTRVLDVSDSAISISEEITQDEISFTLEYKRPKINNEFYTEDMYDRRIELGQRGLLVTDAQNRVMHNVIQELGDSEYGGHIYSATGLFYYDLVAGV